MNEQDRQARRKKRCLTLAKDFIQYGCEDQALVKKLLAMGHSSPSSVKVARDSYAFCLKLGMDNERAWVLSGMNELDISG